MALPKATLRTIQDIAAAHAPRAVEVLAEIMDDDVYDAKDRISAAEKLLNRGHGMPTQAVIVAPAVQAQQRSLAAAKSDDELVAIIDAKVLPRSQPPQPMITINGETEPADPFVPRYRSKQRQPDPLAGPAAAPDEFPTIDPMLL